MVNYERPAFERSFWKGAPHKLVKERAASTTKTRDQEERDLCHTRSGRRCEVIEVSPRGEQRCTRPVTQNHHLIGGSGKRNKGRSLLAAHRLDTCERCHEDITGKVLKPAGSKADAELAVTVKYRRDKLPRKAATR